MKPILLSLLLLISPLPDEKVTLHLSITEVEYTEGKITVQVYRPQDDFLEEGAYKEIAVNPSKPVTELKIDLPPGTYAFSLHHDVNNNQEMDYNLIGMPKEPFGISKFEGGLSKPDFEESSMKIRGETRFEIKLIEI